MPVFVASPKTESSHTMGDRVRRFYQRVLEEQPTSYSVLLGGGNMGAGSLNRYCILGFGLRQTLSVQQDKLMVNGKPVSWENKGPEQLLAELESLYRSCRSAKPRPAGSSLPFHGGIIGYFGYEASRFCDPALVGLPWKDSPLPDIFFCEFEHYGVIDLEKGELVPLFQNEALWRQWERWWAEAGEYVEKSEKPVPRSRLDREAKPIEASISPTWTPEEFADAVTRLQKHIVSGEIYQANLSMRFQENLKTSPIRLYEYFSQWNPSPFAALLQWPGYAIVSNSPERLLEMTPEGRIATRPIAGTRGRGATDEEDERIGRILLTDEKEQAEHQMLVDLARNDLGRVSRPGSVQVDEFLTLERYSHVTHLVSNVVGTKQDNVSHWEILKALFPGGTITGCPKIRCIELLNQFEPVPRGPYTGSLGYIDAATGAMDFNILIRTIYLKELHSESGKSLDLYRDRSYQAYFHAGAGIVFDSIGSHEYRECLRKASAAFAVLDACR